MRRTRGESINCSKRASRFCFAFCGVDNVIRLKDDTEKRRVKFIVGESTSTIQIAVSGKVFLRIAVSILWLIFVLRKKSKKKIIVESDDDDVMEEDGNTAASSALASSSKKLVPVELSNFLVLYFNLI